MRETGRQPWVIQGVLKTTDALSPALNFPTIVVSLSAFTVTYVVLAAIDWVLLARYARRDLPDDGEHDKQRVEQPDPAFLTY